MSDTSNAGDLTIDYGHHLELHTAPLTCTCMVAGWGEQVDEHERNAPASSTAPCGWCGTFSPALALAHGTCMDCGEAADIPGTCSPCESADLVIASILVELGA